MLSGPDAFGGGDVRDLQPLAATLANAVQAHRDEDVAAPSPVATSQATDAAPGGVRKAVAGGSKERPAIAALKCLQQLVAVGCRAAEGASLSKARAELAVLLAPAAAALNVRQQGPAKVANVFEAFLMLLEALVADSSWKEAELVSGMLADLCPHLESETDGELAQRLENVIRLMPRPIGQSSLCRAVAKLLLALTAGDTTLAVPRAMAADIRSSLGPWNGQEVAEHVVPNPIYGKLVDQESALAVAPVLLNYIDSAVEEAIWAMKRLAARMAENTADESEAVVDTVAAAVGAGARGVGGGLWRKTAQRTVQLELAIYARVDLLVGVLADLAWTQLLRWPVLELTIRLAVKVMRMLTTAAKLLIVNKVRHH